MTLARTLAPASLAVLAFLHPAFGQCSPSWRPGTGIPGINGPVFDARSWDPDGAGPAPSVLVAAGNYSVAGEVLTEDVAAWDGGGWSAVGGGIGLDGGDEVAALGDYNGELIASGLFDLAGGAPAKNIARFDGVSWKPLGRGASNYVAALSVYGGDLIAGGFFDSAGGAPASRVARWNGSEWAPLGSGVFGAVNALTVYEGELIATGTFSSAGGAPANRIARWNGSAWQPLGMGLGQGSSGLALAVYNGALYAGGSFISAGLESALNIARWNGSAWSAVGAGSAQGTNGGVRTLTVHNGELIVGGGFTAVAGGAVNATFIARWNGAEWNSVGPGTAVISPGSGVSALCSHDGGLFAGGVFFAAGATSSRNIARWDGPLAGGGAGWSQLGGGFNNGIAALEWFDGAEIAGGAFTSFDGAPVHHVARRSGGAWGPLGAGLDGDVLELEEHAGSLIAGGLFSGSAGVPAPRIARWDGAAWSALGGPGAGADGTVHALAEFRDHLIAGGEFSSIGGVPANQIARWDGSAWHALGSGIAGGQFLTAVSALGVYQGDLYAGGDFTMAGGVPASGVARWDGSAWHALGSGVAGIPIVNAFAEYHGVLYVGGAFSTAGGLNSPRLARWNGAAWSAMNTGSLVAVGSLAVLGEDLVVGGSQLGFPPGSIMRWNDAGAGSWLPMGDGLDQGPAALLVHGGAMSVGGLFSHSGPTVSAFYARWECSCYPDCTSEGNLTVADFTCFQSQFVAGHPYADCNQTGTLTVADFTCFQSAFVAGCP